MIFSHGNPYRGEHGLPDILYLSPDDFTVTISRMNLNAVDHVAKWTILIYMAADCDLAAFMFDDLMEMKVVGSNENVNICVFFDGPLLTDTFFARLCHGTSLEEDIIQRFTDVPSSNVGVLKEIILNTAVLFPAERRVLVLAGHGLGWRGALRDDSTWKRFKERRAIVMPSGDSSVFFRQLDEQRQRALEELKARLNPRDEQHGSAFDIIAMDACNMGNLEALSFYSDHARILVASENQVPASGYPYDRILEELKRNPEQECDAFARYLVNEVKRYYVDSILLCSESDITQVAFDSTGFPALIAHAGELARVLSEYVSTEGIATVKACSGASLLPEEDTDYIDLRLFAKELVQAGVSDAVKQKAMELVAFFDGSGFVVGSATPGGDALPKGLSIYFPPPERFDKGYLDILSHVPEGIRLWAGFIGAYYGKRF